MPVHVCVCFVNKTHAQCALCSAGQLVNNDCASAINKHQIQ